MKKEENHEERIKKPPQRAAVEVRKMKLAKAIVPAVVSVLTVLIVMKLTGRL